MKNMDTFWLWWQQHISKKLNQEQQKAVKVIGANQKQAEKHLTTNNQVNWQQVSKMSLSGRQSLWDAKMGRGSPIWNKLWNNFRKMFLHVKLQRLWRSHHLQNIISSKDSENQEECLWARDKAEGHNWMCVILRPSSSTALKTGTTFYWTSLHGLRNASRNHCLWTQFPMQSTNTS